MWIYLSPQRLHRKCLPINISLIEVHCLHKKVCSVGTGALGTTAARLLPCKQGVPLKRLFQKELDGVGPVGDGGSYQKTINQYDVIYVQPIIDLLVLLKFGPFQSLAARALSENTSTLGKITWGEWWVLGTYSFHIEHMFYK